LYPLIGVAATDEDDHDPAEPEVFDLALIKERVTALSSFNHGAPIDYSYTVGIKDLWPLLT